MDTFGASISDAELSAVSAPGRKSEHLLRAAGFGYSAFDVYAEGATRVFDLNTEALAPHEIGRFDVVTNLGTSEHVANQYNVFKVAHDALKVGGVMLNFVPFFGQIDHGLINYHPCFFTSLIKNNGYRTLFFGLSDVFSGGDIDYYRNVREADNGEKWERKKVGCAEMSVIFLKTSDAAFKPPVDTGGESRVSIAAIYPKPRVPSSFLRKVVSVVVERRLLATIRRKLAG